jgi:formyl-CoA transferase
LPNPTKDTALEGLRVLDLSRLIAGPYATQTLADLGAEVIKIEAPDGGDSSRKLTIPNENGFGAMYIWANRNKKSLCLDLKTPEGKEVLAGLIKAADVIVENFSSKVMAKLGFSYEEVSKINPRIIYCAISAFYRNSSVSERIGFDTVMQAESGLISLTGFKEYEPVRVGPTVVDVTTAINATNAILAALLARERTGRGQYVETSLWAGAVTVIGNIGTNYLITNKNEERVGNSSKNASPAGLYECADGRIYLTCTTDKSFRSFCDKVLLDASIAERDEFKTYEARVANANKLDLLIKQTLKKMTKEDLKKLAVKYGIPLGVYNTVEEAFSSEEMESQNIVKYIHNKEGDRFPILETPFEMPDSLRKEHAPPPRLGEHSGEILMEVLGMGADDVKRLKDKKVVF